MSSRKTQKRSKNTEGKSLLMHPSFLLYKFIQNSNVFIGKQKNKAPERLQEVSLIAGYWLLADALGPLAAGSPLAAGWLIG